MSDLYLSSEVMSSRLPIPEHMKDRLLEAFSLVARIDASLDAPARHLLNSLYNNQFQVCWQFDFGCFYPAVVDFLPREQSFIRYKLVETASGTGCPSARPPRWIADA